MSRNNADETECTPPTDHPKYIHADVKTFHNEGRKSALHTQICTCILNLTPSLLGFEFRQASFQRLYRRVDCITCRRTALSVFAPCSRSNAEPPLFRNILFLYVNEHEKVLGERYKHLIVSGVGKCTCHICTVVCLNPNI